MSRQTETLVATRILQHQSGMAMASMSLTMNTTTTMTKVSGFQPLRLPKRHFSVSNPVRRYCGSLLPSCQYASQNPNLTDENPNNSGHARLSSPIYAAAGSGLEASIGDAQGNLITLKTAKIVVESQDDNKIQVRVDLTGDDTQKVFDRVLTNLARTAPPVPGFRRQKGGKTSKVPKSFLLDILGKERVTKFVIQEIINSTMADYVNKENLTVKENKVSTTQTAEELKLLFTPGNEFGFNATLELETSELETPS
ncbi:uncharacterized protein LOC103946417 isoform X2 [Pyrus x bretschneideri]|uniref:uncharacterized protein LOC103946417 isoform X2 n=1 Tax=Pyrus x bretschneideri TaxID=225117 RepID=UPI00202F78BE|nr:uncharacterized protein LOC103946417 isoform X2 [Pyrus x bretschneideri]